MLCPFFVKLSSSPRLLSLLTVTDKKSYFHFNEDNLVQNVPKLLASLRGGELNLERTQIRLEAVASYAIISALMMGVLMETRASTNTELKEVPNDVSKSDSIHIRFNNVVKTLFSFVTSLSISLMVYNVTVISLLHLYSMTAIGMEKDRSFIDFFKATAGMRIIGFQCFTFSLLSFVFALPMANYLNHEGEGVIRFVETLPAIAVAIYAAAHNKRIIDLAGKLIYSSGSNH